MPVSEDAISAFRASFGGEIIFPGQAGYDEARAVWNGDIDRRPAVIVRPRTPAQVSETIVFARAEDLDLAIRGGGHSYAGHGVSDGGLMINLGTMNTVSVDPQARRASCGGGTTWEQLDGATQEHDLAVTGGFISHTGVAGLTLGGGIGWLTSRAGLTCDSLVSAEVVTADGRIVTASAQSNPDLFWALRGGGGNFGVVTTFEFELHEVPRMANVAMFFWDPEHGRDGLRFSRDLGETLPDDMGYLIAGLSAPPAPFVPPEYQGKPGFALVVANWGSAEDHEKALEPVRHWVPAPQWQLITPIPYVQLQHMFDDSAPWGSYSYEKALYLDELSDDAIDILVEHLPRKASPLSFVPIFPLTGAFSMMADGDTAFGGRRNGKWVFNISASCPTPEMLPQERDWVRTFWSAMRSEAAGSGTYVNFLAEADEDRIRASYGAQKYDRLAEIKAIWDPENVFHRNANIRPARLSSPTAG